MSSNTTFSMDIGWRALLKDLGYAPQRVLRRAGLPEDLFAHADPGLSTEAYFRFWRALEAEANDPMFPLRIADTVSAESFSPALFTALCSMNLMQAVQRLAKYKQLVAPMRLDVDTASALAGTLLTCNVSFSPSRQRLPQVPASLVSYATGPGNHAC